MDPIYGFITAVIGLIHFVYNVLWLRTVNGPFVPPEPIVIFELAWTLISLHHFIRTIREGRLQLLPVSYILYTASAVLYTLYLAHVHHGTVTDAMTPTWWKVYSAGAGAWFTAGGISLMRLGKR